MYVQLRTAGVGTKKGLCPFHDEKSPSFTVRESTGTYHCFGCGEGGDVFSFVMKLNGLDFPEALQYVADKCNVSINWQEVTRGQGGTGGSGAYGAFAQASGPSRNRIIEANNFASKYFQANLLLPEAKPARELLKARNFTAEDCEKFGCGYAMRGKDNLARHLTSKGFTNEEIQAAGLVNRSANGVFDLFQGRLLWPIRDQTGDTLGFGARVLYDDDFRASAKFINTAETRVYKKNRVLYGLDLARKPIHDKREVVVSEGYADVMALHLAGIDTAVASCGTAFTEEHIKIVRRLMGDVDASDAILAGKGSQHQGGRIIYIFDGDKAGLAAAMKAFAMDQEFVMQSYVVIVPDGMDPCDYRIKHGDSALNALVQNVIPMFEFAIKTVIKEFDITNPEGRVGALRGSAAIVAGIKDRSLQQEYRRLLGLWTGTTPDVVGAEVDSAARNFRSAHNGVNNATAYQQVTHANSFITGQLDVSSIRQNTAPQTEIQLMATVIQFPEQIDSDMFFSLDSSDFKNPFFATLFDTIIENGGTDIGAALGGIKWLEILGENFNEVQKRGLSKLTTITLPIADVKEVTEFAGDLMSKLARVSKETKISNLKIKLGALNSTDPGYMEVFTEMMELEAA